MDSLAFLVTLSVAVAVIAWYVGNEAQNADGGIGVFAIAPKDAAQGASQAHDGAPRYRVRERLTPERPGALRIGRPVSAYRNKAKDKPAWRADKSHHVDLQIDADQDN